MNLSKRDQNLLMGLVIIIAVFVFVRFVYMPAQDKIQTLQTTQKELQQEKNQLVKMTPQTSADGKKIEQKYANLNKRLPSEDELVPLLTVLDNNCKKYKVPLVSLEYRGTEEITAEQKTQSGAKTLVFTVTTKGKVTQLFDYLKSLESEQRLISVLDVSLDAVKLEKTGVSVDENAPPTYYIAPPGMPEAKLQRVKFDVVETEEETNNSNQPVASTLVPDTFEMKITINTFYAPEASTTQLNKDGNKQETDSAKNQESKSGKDAKGEV